MWLYDDTSNVNQHSERINVHRVLSINSMCSRSDSQNRISRHFIYWVITQVGKVGGTTYIGSIDG